MYRVMYNKIDYYDGVGLHVWMFSFHLKQHTYNFKTILFCWCMNTEERVGDNDVINQKLCYLSEFIFDYFVLHAVGSLKAI